MVTKMMRTMDNPMKNRICFWCAEGFLLRGMALTCQKTDVIHKVIFTI